MDNTSPRTRILKGWHLSKKCSTFPKNSPKYLLMKEVDSYYWSYIRKNVSLLTVMFAADLKLMICSWMILDGIIYSLIAWS